MALLTIYVTSAWDLPVPALFPAAMCLAAFGGACAIPGAIGRALRWFVAGCVVGLATFGVVALLFVDMKK